MICHSCKNLVPDPYCQILQDLCARHTNVPNVALWECKRIRVVRLSVAFGLAFKNRVLIENRFEYMIFDDARFIQFAVKHIGAKHTWVAVFGEWLNLKMSLVVKRIRERD